MALAFDLRFDTIATIRALAWALAVGIALWTVARRPDAAGRAFALWAIVWAGGVQLVLSLDGMASSAATAQLLYRVAYYPTLFTSAAFLALLCVVPTHVARSAALRASVLGFGLLVLAAFALDHGAFVTETVTDGAYAGNNAGLGSIVYHPLIWTGYVVGLLWLGWQAPAWPERLQRSASWLMAGLGLFAADRFARTLTEFLVAPATLPGGFEGAAYFASMMAFGPGVAWMVLRFRRQPLARRVTRACLAGAAIGATGIVTFLTPPLFGVDLSAAPVLFSALLGPAYVYLASRGALEATTEDLVPARGARAAVLSET